MRNFVQPGQVLTLTPGANVAAGAGHLFGAALFGVATSAVTSGQPGEFITEGVVEIAKTSALEIAVGDILYWVPGSSVVNKTSLNQRAVGVAVAAAGNPSPTVMMKLGVPSEAGTA
jgi:predicted RecA/RadA family phage recombinase